MILSEVEWTSEDVAFPTEIIVRIIEDPALDLSNGTELTISLLDTVIYERSTRKKGSLLPEYNTSEENLVVEF